MMRQESKEAAAPGDASVADVRVIHLVPMLRTGGMEHGVVKLVNGLDARGVRSAICSFHPADGLRDAVAPGIPVYEFAKREGNDPRIVLQLAALFRRWRPDVVHTHSWGTLGEGWTAARLARVRRVVHGEHGTLETRGRNVRVQRWLWKHVDRLLSVSERLADRMAQEVDVPRRTITTIPNGVDLQRFSAAERRSAASTDAQASVTIGTIGRLVPVKDQSNLLRALAMLKAGPPEVRASIVGEGPLRNELDRERRDLGLEQMVQLPGFRSDVEHALASFDIFVLSSQSEGMSNTILEAMASGLPVVATRVGGADELVQDGVTGLLVPPRDPAALAKALDALVSDPEKRLRLGSAGRRRALEQFGLERMLNDYEHLYREVVSARVMTSSLTAAAS